MSISEAFFLSVVLGLTGQVLLCIALLVAVGLIIDAIKEIRKKRGSKKMYIISYSEFGLELKMAVFAYSKEKAIKKFTRQVTQPYSILDIEEKIQ